jgi:hypothetical protein
VASTQSLLYAAESDVTIERVRALVKQVGPEAPTVEYKEKMVDTIARGVAALANTYGGLLLVGVTDDREVRGVKEKTIEAIAEHCQAKIEPPWVPPIIPVRLRPDLDLYVLVLRVVPGQHPRPLLVDGVAYVRHQNTTHPADWQRLRDLFAETGTVIQDDPWTALRAPSVPQGADGTPDSTVDLIIRSGLDFLVSREARWRPLSEKTVTAFTTALEQSALTRAMARVALGAAHTGGSDSFSPRGLNRSRTVTLTWWCAPDGWPQDRPKPVEACARLEVPGAYGHVGQNLHVEIDIVVRHSARAENIRQQSPDNLQIPAPAWRITVPQLGDLIDAMLATLSSTNIVEPLADLAGVDPIAVAPPRVMHLVTERPITDVLETTGLRPIPDAGVSNGAHLLADPVRDLTDEHDRGEQVAAWLTQIAMDVGLRGMEDLLLRLAESPTSP